MNKLLTREFWSNKQTTQHFFGNINYNEALCKLIEDELQNQLKILAPSAVFEPDFRLLMLYCAKLNWCIPNFPIYLDENMHSYIR